MAVHLVHGIDFVTATSLYHKRYSSLNLKVGKQISYMPRSYIFKDINKKLYNSIILISSILYTINIYFYCLGFSSSALITSSAAGLPRKLGNCSQGASSSKRLNS